MFEFLLSVPIIGPTLAFLIPTMIVLGIVVAIHEYGHYIVGRWCGIGADVFSIGFGPKLYSRVDKRGTVWQISAIPLGGYVKFKGDLDAASTQGKENLSMLSAKEAATMFPTAALWRRTLTVTAGPAANFILSIIVFTALILNTGKPVEEPIVGAVIKPRGLEFQIQEGDKLLKVDGQAIEDLSDLYDWAATAKPNPVVTYTVERDGQVLDQSGPFPWPSYITAVQPVSAASKAGLRGGDLILSIDGNDVASFEQLKEVVSASEIKEVPIVVLRDGAELTLTIKPRYQETEVEAGKFERKIMLGVVGAGVFEAQYVSIGFGEAVQLGAKQTWNVITNSLRGIKLIANGTISAKNLQGPVGIAHTSRDIAQAGWLQLIQLIAVISTAIGFLNLLPIPVLDGGHLVQFAYQAVVGKPMNEQIIRYATLISLSLLLTLMLFSTSNDLIRFFQ